MFQKGMDIIFHLSVITTIIVGFVAVVTDILPLVQSRKLQENGWKPKWFEREGEDGPFRYMGGYWEARDQGKWDGCPNIFGEFTEDLVNSYEGSGL
ncbi:Oxysterol-binding protein-related protein 2A [Vitis vinifera]|uniref:Oxysterol-binding protein-related protein 2A n=1 Tax=Vitis vinifera TaxID=29760 RepID=A0A438ESB2_VITVI|nr:Oxysterol-binding protein-related protein 2A [Vitis vinifera]RVX15618.1 Oxysterol-binding protein-related protein 2A [Vitis vinifera]